MNRKSYIDLLRYYLRDLPQNVIDDIVMDYEEHFAMGLSGGKSEEEISEELGSPEIIAKEFLTIEPGRTRVRRITDQEKKLLEENESRASEILKWIGIIALIVVLSPTILSIFGVFIGLVLAALGVFIGLVAAGIFIIGGLVFGTGSLYVSPSIASLSILTQVLMALFLIALGILILALFISFIRWLIKTLKKLYISLKWRWERRNER